MFTIFAHFPPETREKHFAVGFLLFQLFMMRPLIKYRFARFNAQLSSFEPT